MDAAYTFLKKSAFLVVASALLLATPTVYTGPTIIVNPVLTSNTIQLSNSSCNDFQVLTLTSSQNLILPVNISVEYVSSTSPQASDPVNGQWVYATATGGSGSPPTNSTVTDNAVGITIPAAGTGTTPNSLTLTIGLQRTLPANILAATAFVLVHVPGDTSGASDVLFTVDYAYNASCGGNVGSLTNGKIVVTPGTLTMTAAQGASQQMTLQIQNATSGDLSFTAIPPSTDTWLSSDSTSSTSLPANGSVNVTITANATGLNVTDYSSMITITPSAGGGTVLFVPVSFAVTAGSGGGGGGSGNVTLNGGTTATATFQYIVGAGLPASQCIAIAESVSSVTTYSYTVSESSGGSWLNVNGNYLGQTNQSFSSGCLTVQPNSSTPSTPGAYTATVVVTDSGGSTATATITLEVTAAAASGVTVTPGLIYNFPGVTTGATATETQLFTATGTSPVTLTPAASIQSQSPSTWLTIDTPAGVATGTETFNLTANPSGLSLGLYSAIVQVPSTTGTTTILVTLSVGQSGGGGGGGGGTVTSIVLPTQLYFASEFNNNAWSGGSEAQDIVITGANGAQWSSSVAYGSGGTNWLRFGGASGSTQGTIGGGGQGCATGATLCYLSVDIQPSSLSPSSTPYTAQITVTTPSGSTQVNVSLLVTSTGNHVLLASPALEVFSYSGGTNPASQHVIFSDTNGAFPGTSGSNPPIGVTTTSSWLTATSVGNTMTLSVNASGLATGVYAGTVTVTSGSYPNSPLTYPVIFIVNGGTTTGPLTLSTSGLTFNAIAGGSVPASQNVTVTAASSTSASAGVSEQSCTGFTWLTIAPSGNFTASTSNSIFSVSANQAGISAGTTCNGTVSFTASSSVQTVSVTMVVTGSSTSNNVTATPNTLTFNFTVGGSNPATQTVAIANAGTGTPPLSFTVTSSASWLTTNAGSSSVSTPYSLVVTANPSSLTASSTPYTGTLTISPVGGTPVVVNVSFAIAGAPVVSATPTTMTFTYSVGANNPPTQTIQVNGGGAQAPFTVSTSSSGWLSVSPACTTASPCTTPNTGTFNLTVTANPSGLNVNTNGYNGSITIAGTGTASGSTIVNVAFTVTAPLPTITGVTNAASYATGPVSPGEIISIFANSSAPIGPTPAVQLNSTNCPSPCTAVPTNMGGVQVEFLPNGVFAPLTYVSATQINCVVPYEVQGVQNLSVEVKYLGQPSNAFVLQTATTAPGMFTANSSGSGPGAILQYDPSGAYQGVNSSSNPASPGWYLTLYVTGEGSIPGAVTGKVISSTTVYPLLGPPTVLIDSQPAGGTYFYYAEAYGFVSGLMQVNVQIPSNVHTGQADTISVSIGGHSSQAGVTVAMK